MPMRPLIFLDHNQSSRYSKIVLFMLLLPNIILIRVGFLMVGHAQHAPRVKETGHFELTRFLR
jgi:hypothetical protein